MLYHPAQLGRRQTRKERGLAQQIQISGRGLHGGILVPDVKGMGVLSQRHQQCASGKNERRQSMGHGVLLSEVLTIEPPPATIKWAFLPAPCQSGQQSLLFSIA